MALLARRGVTTGVARRGGGDDDDNLATRSKPVEEKDRALTQQCFHLCVCN